MAHDYSKKIVTIKATDGTDPVKVWGNVDAGVFGVSGNNAAVSIAGLPSAAPGADTFTVTFLRDITAGTDTLSFTNASAPATGATDMRMYTPAADPDADPLVVADVASIDVTDAVTDPDLPRLQDLSVELGQEFTTEAPLVTLPEAVENSGVGAITYSVTGTLPASLAFDATSRKISGTVSATAEVRDYTVSYVAEDSAPTPTEVSRSFTITVMAPLALPGKPQNLMAEPGDRQVMLSWQAPPATGDDSGGAVESYEYDQNASGNWMDAGTGLTKTVMGLTNGTTYVFQVRAKNRKGPGPPTAGVSVIPTDPEPVAALSVTVSAAPTTIAEGGMSTITAMANRMVMASDGEVTVNLSVVPPAGATLSAESITIAANSDSGTVTLTAAEDDDDYEDETVTVVASGDGISGNQPVEITVTDNDTRPTTTDPVGRITKIELERADERDIDGKRLHIEEGEHTKVNVTIEWTDLELQNLTAGDYVTVRLSTRWYGADLTEWLSPVEFDHDVNQHGHNVQVEIPKLPAGKRVATKMGSVQFTVGQDDDAEAEVFRFWVQNDEAFNPLSVVETLPIVIEDTDPQGVTLKRNGSGLIYEGGEDVVFEVAADPPRVQLDLDVRFDLEDVIGQTVASRDNRLTRSGATISPGPDEKESVTISLDKNDENRKDDKLKLMAEVVSYALDTGAYEGVTSDEKEFVVFDVHKLPWLTVDPPTGMVEEGGEIELTLKVNRNPADTIAIDPEKRRYTSEELTIAVTAGGSASSSDFTMTPSAITVPEYKHATDPGKDWMQDVKVTIAASADEDIDAETLMLDFVVNGATTFGPRPDDDTKSVAQANLTIQDATATLVSVRENAYDVIKGALGDPPMLTTGMSAELMGSNLFDYDSAAVSVAYATSVEGGAVTASASGGTVTIMGAMAGEAKVTITATATPTSSSLVVNQTKANVAQMTFPVMVADEDLVFNVAGPDDMNLAEGGMGGMITVTTNRPATENPEVMLRGDGSSSASDDDYMLAPPLVTIMAGQMEGHTMVMATEDNMAEEMEMLTLFLAVDGMQMTDKSVSFYIWDAAVPALPIIAQLLLAAFLALGGSRRYRRR
ncbi:MAG: fibronectin type III domain-containing protein [Chloroflexi bacterium]|nr:fibronectin type III domain-containing protein [Chloroflexota bacterium]